MSASTSAAGTTGDRSARALRRTILAIFVLSGMAGLVYEVVWARQLVLVFGNTTQAVSTILTGFFGGMALGSWLGGRVADRVVRPLRMYGLLEIILAAVVLATPLTFRLIGTAYAGVFGTLETMPVALALVRFALAILALAPATILMGATLPTLTRYLSRDAAHLSAAFGRLYAANTIGAILGAAAAGLVLIEVLGLTGALAVGAACSATAGATAFVLDRRRRAVAATSDTPGPDDALPAGFVARAGTAQAIAVAVNLGDPVPAAAVGNVKWAEPADEPSRQRIALVVAFVSGLTSLAYQTLWTRLLAAGSGNSTYVFTAILMVFLFGLAIGAVLFTLLRTRLRHTVRILAAAQVAVALLALAGVALVISRSTGTAPDLGTLRQAVVLVVLPATIVMGLSFPAASALVSEGEGRIATSAGLLLASNTLGAIVGTFIVPFVVIPLAGSAPAIGLVALVNAALGIGLALRGGVGSRTVRLATAGAGAAALGIAVGGLVAGTVFIDPSVARLDSAGGHVAASREDEIASVQAGSLDGRKQLWVTGTSMTLLTVDAKLMPILPLMLRPESTSALVVAFGMGSAFRSAVIAGLDTTAVELVPSVPGMFGYFYPDADAILARPNGRVVVTDGRNHLELADRSWDIIVTDPPPPIESAGVSVISSLEYYRAGRGHLTPGGVMMQWVPYGQTIDEFQAHVRTFASVFRHVTIAVGRGGYGFYMLGSTEPMAFSEDVIREVLARPGVLEDISGAYDSPAHEVDAWVETIDHMPWIADDRVAAFAGPGPLVTDDRPLPEYFLLRRLLDPSAPRVTPRDLAEAGFPLP